MRLDEITLAGRLEPDDLPAVLLFVAGMRRSGTLRITRDALVGELRFRSGSVADGQCATARGIEALEWLVLAPGSIEFSFVGAPFDASEQSLLDLPLHDLGARLNELESRRRRIAQAVPSLAHAVRLAEPGTGDENFTLNRRHLAVLLAVDASRSAAEVIEGDSLVRGLEALADLVDLDLVRFGEPVARRLSVGQAATTSAPFNFARVRSWLLHARRRLRLRWETLAWGAIGLFILVSGFVQWPDIARQVAATPRTELPFTLDAPPSTPSDVVWPSDPSGPFWIAPDGYHVAPRVQGAFVAVRPPIVTVAADIAIGGRFRVINAPTGATFGFIIRDVDSEERNGLNQNGRFLLFGLNDDGKAVVRRRTGARWDDTATTAFQAFQHNRADAHQLQVTAVGPQIAFRIDDAEVAKITDGVPSSGGAGIYVEGADAEVLMDHLSLQVL